MPTLSEVQEHAADAEHQAFQRAYDELLNVAKDPITCRHFWDAGFAAGQADANDMLTVAHMDGYAKGRDAMREMIIRALNDAAKSIELPKCSDAKGEYFKAGAVAAIHAFNAVIAKHRGQP